MLQLKNITLEKGEENLKQDKFKIDDNGFMVNRAQW